jgi:phosphodiesterase/alkaline phosphatase D-like protein
VPAHPLGPLQLGPLLRHVGVDNAPIWVQTTHRARVTVRAGGQEWSAPTFTVEGFHYALVVCDGLESGAKLPYTVEIDGEHVWPPADSPYPPSVIATIVPGESSRIAFGSCRTSSPHDAAGNKIHGVDALRAYAVGMADDDSSGWPDIFCFLGDQVYADEEISDEMVEFIKSRRDIDEEPGEEIRDYVEYDFLYQLAWSDPATRWLLSTVPSTMIFDDHDVRDDWNTSYSWRKEIQQTSWWQRRIVSALASYWVYQHVGNLSPARLEEDEVWQRIRAHAASGAEDELDLTGTLEALATRADAHPETYRWSYVRELGDARIVVVDSRAARKLDPDHRSMLDEDEMSWLDGQLRGDTRHLFIGTSLPFLLPPGLHDFEAMDEQVAQNAYGRTLGRAGEALRRVIDLEHWAAFNEGFEQVFEMVMSVARGERGRPPEMITFLSGDVHNSYLAEVLDPERYGAKSRIVQAVCSPMRNPMPRAVRVFMSLFARGLVKPMRAIAGRSSKVSDPRYPWKVTQGPWFDNNLAVVEVDGDSLRFRWWTGAVEGGDVEHPTTRVVAEVVVG